MNGSMVYTGEKMVPRRGRENEIAMNGGREIGR
jgi:hypothetical protein